MMSGLIVFHVIVCLMLTVVVLLQFGKGAESGALMGQGGSQAVFTSSQSGNFFSKLTTVLAIFFMVNSIAISTLKSRKSHKSVLDGNISAETAVPLNMDAVQKNAKPNTKDLKAKAVDKKTQAPKKSKTKK
jgi:preprotein translocase subunit SecG